MFTPDLTKRVAALYDNIALMLSRDDTTKTELSHALTEAMRIIADLLAEDNNLSRQAMDRFHNE